MTEITKDSIKKEHDMTSEELFNISKQPEETCPLIDYVLKSIKNANSANEYIVRKHHNYTSIEDLVLDIEMTDIKQDMEDIRKNCMKIRERWQQRKDLARDMFLKLSKEDKKRFINDITTWQK